MRQSKPTIIQQSSKQAKKQCIVDGRQYRRDYISSNLTNIYLAELKQQSTKKSRFAPQSYDSCIDNKTSILRETHSVKYKIQLYDISHTNTFSVKVFVTSSFSGILGRWARNGMFVQGINFWGQNFEAERRWRPSARGDSARRFDNHWRDLRRSIKGLTRGRDKARVPSWKRSLWFSNWRFWRVDDRRQLHERVRTRKPRQGNELGRSRHCSVTPRHSCSSRWNIRRSCRRNCRKWRQQAVVRVINWLK